MRRIQSASSINMYKQCPRKYYYRYIQKLPDEPNIHAIRGSIVHEALEHFFKMPVTGITNYKVELPRKLEQLFDLFWIQNKAKLQQLKLTIEELNHYYSDSRMMLSSWMRKFLKKLDDTITFQEAFEKLRPDVEEEFVSQKLGVRGFVDAIYHTENGLEVIDYKTSRKDIVTPEYSLQAGIYALLIGEIKGEYPKNICFDFLKGETRPVPVDEVLLKQTKFEIENMHASTDSEDARDYPRKPSGLCKWSNERGSGQCPFYDVCKPRNPELWED